MDVSIIGVLAHKSCAPNHTHFPAFGLYLRTLDVFKILASSACHASQAPCFFCDADGPIPQQRLSLGRLLRRQRWLARPLSPPRFGRTLICVRHRHSLVSRILRYGSGNVVADAGQENFKGLTRGPEAPHDTVFDGNAQSLVGMAVPSPVLQHVPSRRSLSLQL